MKRDELCARTGETPRGLRFLIAEGFIPPAKGTRFGEYTEEHVEAIRRYQELRAAKLGPNAIRSLMRGEEARSPLALVVPGGAVTLNADLRTLDIVEFLQNVESILRTAQASMPSLAATDHKQKGS